jgi:P27 family predicted phage terminase small subunit
MASARTRSGRFLMAASSRPRPAALKLVEGRAPGRDSGGRKVPTPPPFKRIPPHKPSYLSPMAAALWDRIVDELPRLGLLKELDGSLLEMLCETYARWRKCVAMRQEAAKAAPTTAGIIAKNSQGYCVAPWVAAETQASKEFRALCIEFGLSPAAEMRLATPGANPDDPHAGNPFGG